MNVPVWLAASLAAAMVTFGLPVRAEAPPQAQPWSVFLGLGGSFGPDYQGSDDYELGGLPQFAVSYRDLVFLRGPSLGANLLTVQGPRPGDRLRAGPIARLAFGRDQDDNDALNGLGDIDLGVELGGFVSYWTAGWTAQADVFKEVADGHDGTLASFKLGYGVALAPRLRASIDISTTWADDTYMDAFFGISPAQAARSGLPAFDAASGFKDAGVTLGLNFSLTRNWVIGGRVGYTRAG